VKVEILDEAERDLIEGFRFFEAQEKGLGDYFFDSLSADIDSLRLYAGIHTLHLGHHRLLSKRFPFAVYYEVDGNRVRVNAILDCRRDPAWIKERLK
jgi:plasmid stabilization system protein ParE